MNLTFYQFLYRSIIKVDRVLGIIRLASPVRSHSIQVGPLNPSTRVTLTNPKVGHPLLATHLQTLGQTERQRNTRTSFTGTVQADASSLSTASLNPDINPWCHAHRFKSSPTIGALVSQGS